MRAPPRSRTGRTGTQAQACLRCRRLRECPVPDQSSATPRRPARAHCPRRRSIAACRWASPVRWGCASRRHPLVAVPCTASALSWCPCTSRAPCHGVTHGSGSIIADGSAFGPIVGRVRTDLRRTATTSTAWLPDADTCAVTVWLALCSWRSRGSDRVEDRLHGLLASGVVGSCHPPAVNDVVEDRVVVVGFGNRHERGVVAGGF